MTEIVLHPPIGNWETHTENGMTVTNPMHDRLTAGYEALARDEEYLQSRRDMRARQAKRLPRDSDDD